MKMTTRAVTGTALLLALGVVLPILFHAFPFGGRMLLPMHIPVLIAGLSLGPASGAIVGAGSPLLSMLLTGMPPVPLAVPMTFELTTYGLMSGLVRSFLASRRGASGQVQAAGSNRTDSGHAGLPTRGHLWAALLAAMVAGRAVWMAAVTLLAPLVGIEARTLAVAIAALAAGWPGMAVQLALIPPTVTAIERGRRT